MLASMVLRGTMHRWIPVVLAFSLCCGCYLFKEYDPYDASTDADGATDLRSDGDGCSSDTALDGPPPGPAHMYARYAEPADVEVDAQLDEYGPLQSEFHPDAAQETDNRMSVRARWTREYLYLGIRVRDASIETPDAKIYWQQDGVEVAWEPEVSTRNGLSDRAWKWGLTADGALDAARVQDGGWNGDADTPPKTEFAFGSTLDDGYRLELALPWSASNIAPEQRDTLLICIRNNDRDDDSVRRLGCSTNGPFVEPETWGELHLIDSRRQCGGG